MDNISAITGTINEGRQQASSPQNSQNSARRRVTSPSKKVSMNDNSTVKARYLMSQEEIAEANKVTPEMKQKLREESAKIWEERARNNALLQKNTKDTANKKIAEKKRHSEIQLQKWGDLIKNSPFHTDFNLIHEKQEEYMKAKQAEMKLRKKQADTIRKMTGGPKHDIQDREIEAHTVKDMKSKLALQYRATKLGRYTLLSEKEQMDRMVMNECEEIIRKFPTVGLRLAFESNSYMNNNVNNSMDSGRDYDSYSPSNSQGGSGAPFGLTAGGAGAFSFASTNSTPSITDSFNNMQNTLLMGGSITKRRYDADEIKKMKEDRDNTNYRAEGRYSVSGNFIETKSLKTTVGMTVVEV